MTRLSRVVAVLALAAALLFVFAGQVRDPGFHRGHRGWVSAHTLAIAQKASASNGFVGYAIELATPTSRALHYFDRYPVFFSAGLHAAWTMLGLDAAGRILFARQVMNLVYVLTVVAAVALLVELGLALELSIAAAAAAAAAFTMVNYRDMVHFDQPALLGSVVLMWAIARWYRGGRAALVLAATALAVTAGRGYASFVVLGLWWLMESLQAFRTARAHDALASSLLGVPARACILGAALAAACLAWNIAAEARIRDVPWSEASIVRSATRRLALDPGFNEQNQQRLSWPRFLRAELENFSQSVLPWTHRPRRSENRALRLAVAIAAAVVAVAFARSCRPPARVPALLMLLAGPLWLVLMRNVAAFHPYLGVYLFPVALLCFAGLLRRVPARAAFVPAIAAAALLVFSTSARNRDLLRDSHVAARWTRDMQRIAALLGPGEAVAQHRMMQGVPYALGFYLPEQALQVEGKATWVVSSQRDFDSENLTPDNDDLFLYRPARPYRAHTALARFHPDSLVARFGSRPSVGPLRR